MDLNEFRVTGDSTINLNDYQTNYTGGISEKKIAKKLLSENIKSMRLQQDKFYAYDKYSLLIIFQAMDAAGKDSAIKHVMSGLNPQGTQVFSFKEPSKEELDHDYLWRTTKALPERGRIGIFNRSYYEEVLVVRVHNLVQQQKIPKSMLTDSIWEDRYEQIRNFERHIHQNGTVIIKFFLNLSKEEQKIRFLKRLEIPKKNWKFSEGDLVERKLWSKYQECYEYAINNTSTSYAPWYIIPADNKWFSRLVISEVITKTISNLDIKYPKLTIQELKKLNLYKERLKTED